MTPIPPSPPELAERLKQEAQIHAQEARTANATIAEIYQLCTGATGEPGNWNGAEPVRALIAAHEAEVGRLLEALEEIALAGMSPSPEMSQDGVTAWHARQAWRFIGIAARAISPDITKPKDFS